MIKFKNSNKFIGSWIGKGMHIILINESEIELLG